ncbi:hypothetical protein PanWU01x14_237310 [Parasponia andersonii]|uniref:Uncharacterized protein n=1 Tax=Parasponia andersonii TaxID=3476 RepID=A0A2P5BI16_PARAD|nr:hypothetical protein PanWU01x14_237310 [Parasponia andersonii]
MWIDVPKLKTIGATGCARHRQCTLLASLLPLPKAVKKSPVRDSLVKKFGYKFPNCVGDLTNRDYLYSQLHFGSEIEFEGESIPMEVGGVYRVSLESTSLDGERLAIGPEKALINT